MSDEADDAFDSQMALERAIMQKVRQQAITPLPTSKKCLECGSKTIGGARWCDSECSTIYCKRNGIK